MNIDTKILNKIFTNRNSQYKKNYHDQVEFVPEIEDCFNIGKYKLS